MLRFAARITSSVPTQERRPWGVVSLVVSIHYQNLMFLLVAESQRMNLIPICSFLRFSAKWTFTVMVLCEIIVTRILPDFARESDRPGRRPAAGPSCH